MVEAVIVDAVRTPVGVRTGRRYTSICTVMPQELLARCLMAITDRTGIDPALIEDVVAGTAGSAGNYGRQAALLAGYPVNVAGAQVNRACAGAATACQIAAMQIMTGYADVSIGAGVECMSRSFGVARDPGPEPTKARSGAPIPPTVVSEFQKARTGKYIRANMGQSAEAIAKTYNISRETMDDFGFWSQTKAIKAAKEGKFKNEIVPIPTKQPDGTTQEVTIDETIRFNAVREKMNGLRPAFIPPPFMGITEGLVTAGNSSPVSDGAAAVMFMSREKADELGLEARAVIKPGRMAIIGVDPGPLQLTGPGPATLKVLKRSGLTIDQMDWIECNEAFASVVIRFAEIVGIPWNDPRINPHGGAIALGHPLGETGAKLIATMLNGMEDRDLKYGVMTMCVGGGQGVATIIEREK